MSQCSEIKKEHPKVGLKNKVIINTIHNFIRTVKELRKENDLPKWMK
jgi:hypothetical protein